MPPAVIRKAHPEKKKVVFDDEGEIVSKGAQLSNWKKNKSKQGKETIKSDGAFAVKHDINEKQEEEVEDYFAKREKMRLKQQDDDNKKNAAQKKWFNVYPQYPVSEDELEIKDKEQLELYNLCKGSFEGEMSAFNKRNPSDYRWLQTALHRGTAKDRANAGALLVTSNSLGNLEALNTLIGFTKPSNKSSPDVIAVLTDLWKEVLLPPYRKLQSLQMRGSDWKQVRKDSTLKKEQQKLIFAYWYFENELKDYYFEFLKNVQMGIQTGQENNKIASIKCASQLLAFAPEKEQMLLTMLVNKLGDPIAKVASKALYHLTEVAHKHPNMCGIIVAETEKLLFRNNISERAQHFALCFLASIAPAGRPEVCSKLVHICFSFFKVLVQKGAVNNRTMQAILRCLQKAILEAQPTTPDSGEILSKEMQDTIYRLVHLADIRVSVQTLGLLLQLISVKTETSDRFYNALYKKLLDLELTNIGMKTASQLLHIVHRAIHIDVNMSRAQAFIKRLLQLALYTLPHLSAGCLIVINKLLHSRKELLTEEGNRNDGTNASGTLHKVTADDDELARFDSDGEEKYEDVAVDDSVGDESQEHQQQEIADVEEKPAAVASSWHHVKMSVNENPDESVPKVRELSASKYDAYHRVPAFAGAELALCNELLLLREHYHPTVQVFADNILNQKHINYYGDPLRDFGLPHFLERFAFKNPKKLAQQQTETPTILHKRYVSFGARGRPVKALTKVNCTEDEMFIFNFLEQKRKQAVVYKVKKTDEAAGDDDLLPDEVNDDEFDEYLDGFFGKKGKAAAAAAEAEEDDEELDFLKELGGELKTDRKQEKKRKKATADDVEDIEADWGDDEDAEFTADSDGDNGSVDEVGSIDLDEDEDEERSVSLDGNDANDDSDDMSDPADSMSEDEDTIKSKSKQSKHKPGTRLNEKSFAKRLKHSTDMSSLFAAADDFADLLEETGKTKGQGTANAVFNRDKSSDKQMSWEQKRHSNSKSYAGKRGNRFRGNAVATKKRKQ